jgi:hypothetical protein
MSDDFNTPASLRSGAGQLPRIPWPSLPEHASQWKNEKVPRKQGKEAHSKNIETLKHVEIG